jgi:shikimate dehydrogenase
MKRFAVIGHPVAHSLSPLLHGKAYDLLHLDCGYETFDIPPEALPAALRDFQAQGFTGLNVTLPHKEAIAKLVESVTDEAGAVGAVNTILFRGNLIAGDNTDVYGFAASVEPVRESIEGRTVLLLGAGGSARAVVYALLSRFKPAEIVVANRDEDRGRELLRHFAHRAGGVDLKSGSLEPAKLSSLLDRAGLIVNCTSLGLSPAVDGCPVKEDTLFRSDQVVVDLIYTPLQTRLLALATESGARTISGLEMFLHQGARSFELWLGQPMPIDAVRPVIIHELERQQKESRQHP